MNANSARWQEISPSEYSWEREALDFVRDGLPDVDPIRVWSNFEFIAEDGSIHEVDLLVLTSKGFFLVEIKSWPGNTEVVPGQWTVHLDGRIHVRDNPLLLANRKAKKLASLLRSQRAPFPFLRPLIFLSHPDAKAHIDQSLREAVFLRDRAAADDMPARAGIRRALLQPTPADLASPSRASIDRRMVRELVAAMEALGIRPSRALKRVGDYKLGDLLFDGPSYQDFAARHVSLKNTVRRVRIYGVARAAGAEQRQTIQRAARREFELLEGIQHAGILRVHDYKEHEAGPALLFEHDPTAVRLDQFLVERGAQLSVDERLDLLRQIAEAVRYAHEKKLVHRALSPRSILVLAATARPRVVLFNWQTAARDLGSAGGTSTGRTFTEHLGQLVEDAATVYMAPEVWTDLEARGETLDVFGLGAIAYHLFTGRPPAASATDLLEKLRASQGLDPAGALDGAGEELRKCVRASTHPEVSLRVDSVKEFLDLLDAIEDKLTRPEPDAVPVADPTEAKAGDLLDGGLTVVKRLGKGSCAVAFLVKKDGREVVLKLSLGPDHDDRLRDEGEVITQLRHARIVGLVEPVRVGDRTGLLLEKAGDETLAQRLRRDGRLALDWLSRFGEDLLDAVRFLEEKGIPHRDIKPDNLGIGEVGRDRVTHLVLFDFSLSRTSAERIRAGTAPYLEPFLALRRPARWDVHAERYAAGVTLYEMATGTLPRWGDGRSDPAAISDEVTIESDLFDSGVRDRLTAFFRKALRRDLRARYDTAEDMLRAWRHVFERIGEPVTQTDHAGDEASQQLLAAANLETPISLLGFSTRAVNALERANVITVRELVAVAPSRISHMRGVGNKTRKELWEAIQALTVRFPRTGSETPSKATEHDAPSDEPLVSSLDLLVHQLLPGRVAKNATAEPRALRLLLRLEAEDARGPGDWPSQTQVAERLDVTRARVGQLTAKARERWRRNPSLTAVRDEIVLLLRASGGVMTAAELTRAILAARGSTQSEPLRTRYAGAVARAATEAERSLTGPRWSIRRAGRLVLLALDLPDEGIDGQALADWAEALGRRADALAVTDPLPGAQRVIEELSSLPRPEGAIPTASQRIVQLAAAASQEAAVSSLLELYPRGMGVDRALRLAQGALLGAPELSPDQLRARIAARYPEAAELPARPALDGLLRDAGFGWVWSPEACDGHGGYRPPASGIASLSSGSTSLTRFGTVAVPPVDPGPEVANARAFEEKLLRAARDGAWLVLAVTPALAERAEHELQRRVPSLDARSLEDLLLRAMKDEAARAGADWNVVLGADAAAPTSADGRTLRQLVDLVLPRVERELAVSSKTLLLTRPGLLARYDRLALLQRLRDRVGRRPPPGEEPLFGAWLLVPCSEQAAAPQIDGKPVPVVTPSEWARIPEAWVLNRHRGSHAKEPM